MDPAVLTDLNRFTSLRITRPSSSTLAHAEAPEATNFYPPTRSQGLAHVFQQRLDALLDGGGWQMRIALGQQINEVRAEHARCRG
ncbi:MAG: hypothetical protein RLZZ09_1973 [Pseudomonadota bacterium]